MGKRKKNDYEVISAKIRKLERKLKKRHRRSSSSSSMSMDDSYIGSQDEHDISPRPTSYYDLDPDDTEYREKSDEEAAKNEARLLPQETSAEDPTISEEVLDPDILLMLGEDPTVEKDHGEDLHKDLAARWTHILLNGLPKEAKVDLIKEYLPPKNCPNMKAPKLNLEIEAALTPINIKKDLFSQSKQNQLSSCLAAIGKVLNLALSTKDVIKAQDIIKPLSDAGRIISDCQYRESQSRRYAIINSLNKQTRDVIKNTKIDECLFGSNLSEHLKSAKAIVKSGHEMKSVVQRPPAKIPTPRRTTQRGALNGRGTSRAGAFEPRQNPAPRRPALQDRYRDQDRDRHHNTSRRNNYSARRGYSRRQ